MGVVDRFLLTSPPWFCFHAGADPAEPLSPVGALWWVAGTSRAGETVAFVPLFTEEGLALEYLEELGERRFAPVRVGDFGVMRALIRELVVRHPDALIAADPTPRVIRTVPAAAILDTGRYV